MDKNTRLETLYKSYLKRWDTDPFFKDNCNIQHEEVYRNKYEETYSPYSLLEFRKELNNDLTILEWYDNGCLIFKGTFFDVYGDFLLKRNFTMFGYNNITPENSIDYCHFLLKHKGKLHNAFGNRYKSLIKELEEIVDTDIFPEYYTMSLQGDSFFLRLKYDKRLKRLMKKQYSSKPEYISKQLLNKWKNNSLQN